MGGDEDEDGGVLHGVVARFPGWASLLCWLLIALPASGINFICTNFVNCINRGQQIPAIKNTSEVHPVIGNGSGFMRYLGLGISTLALSIHSLGSHSSNSSQT